MAPRDDHTPTGRASDPFEGWVISRGPTYQHVDDAPHADSEDHVDPGPAKGWIIRRGATYRRLDDSPVESHPDRADPGPSKGWIIRRGPTVRRNDAPASTPPQPDPGPSHGWEIKRGPTYRRSDDGPQSPAERPALRMTRRPTGTPMTTPPTADAPTAERVSDTGFVGRLIQRVLPGPAGRLAESILPHVGRDHPSLLNFAPLALTRTGDDARPGAVRSHLGTDSPPRPTLNLTRPATASTLPAATAPDTPQAAPAAADGAGAGGDTGMTAIDFPPPPGAPGPADASTVGGEPNASSGPVAVPQPADQSGSAGGPQHHIGPSSLDGQIDAIYDGVVERLRRDILVERERMGDLVGDLLR